MPEKSRLMDWIDKLQSQGHYTFTRQDVAEQIQRSFIAAQTALRRLRIRGRIVSPRRGFYVIVPPEYRAVGSPPASWFIDELMKHLGQPYYVGLLSAAALHGAGHQQPMVTQIVTDRPTRPIKAEKVTIKFSVGRSVKEMPVLKKQTETGFLRVATPEVTAFDLIRYQSQAGHLSNVTTVLSELAERLSGGALLNIADLMKIPDVQRLGYMLEHLGENHLSDPLFQWLGDKKPRAVYLSPGSTSEIRFDKRWKIRINVEVKGDL
jgi:predicted transcriptional regulator of viral defense system